jgi:hypothetical protein
MNEPDLRNRLTSTLLAPLPRIPTGGRGRRLLLRWIVAGLWLAMFYLLIVTVAYQALPKSGAGYLLYWIHDNVYLPIKGYTYTLFFPTSLVWWLSGSTVLILWGICWLSDRSLVRRPHILLLRWSLGRHLSHPLLLACARLFARLGLQPQMLSAVAEQMWRRQSYKLSPLPGQKPSSGEQGRLCDLAIFRYRLCSLSTLPPATNAHLQAFCFLHETLFLLHYHRDNTKDSRQLEDERRIRQLLDWIKPQPDWLKEQAWKEDKPFSPNALLGDLYLLFLMNDPLLLEAWFGEEMLSALPPHPMLVLAQRVSTRTIQLGKVQRQLEQLIRQTDRPPRLQAKPFLDEWSDEERAAMGELAMSIAIHVASVVHDPHLALHFMDTVNALKLTAALIAPEPASPVADLHRQIKATLYRLPRPVDDLMCAQLLDQFQRDRLATWQKTSFARHEERPIQEIDINLGRNGARDLLQAAGPAYATVLKEEN